MASEELRKKWGTIFMGERESTMEQLDAMYEPLRQEQARQEQEEDYLERVRAKATDKARQILGEAYTERQKVLEEARAEVESIRAALQKEGASIRSAAMALKDEAVKALAQAQEERDAARRIREAAHDEGFQAGMEQASEELKEFRAELGQSLGVLLKAIESQMASISAAWREDLADLTCTAVAAGTGWVLETEHEKILHSLVIRSLKLLEDRITVVIRVNPEDEAAVSDMFLAARERVPELKQWRVNGDPSMMRGGLIAESGSGSVDCRRELFQELVTSVLNHLALGQHEREPLPFPIAEIADREAARIAALAPPLEAASLHGSEPASAVTEAAVAEEGVLPTATTEAGVESDDPPYIDTDSEISPEILANLPPDEISYQDENVMSPAQPEDPGLSVSTPESVVAPVKADVPSAWIPPLGDDDDIIQEAVDIIPEARDEQPASRAKASPSLEELEEELFPLQEGEQGNNVFVDGGFLPAADTAKDKP